MPFVVACLLAFNHRLSLCGECLPRVIFDISETFSSCKILFVSREPYKEVLEKTFCGHPTFFLFLLGKSKQMVSVPVTNINCSFLFIFPAVAGVSHDSDIA